MTNDDEPILNTDLDDEAASILVNVLPKNFFYSLYFKGSFSDIGFELLEKNLKHFFVTEDEETPTLV